MSVDGGGAIQVTLPQRAPLRAAADAVAELQPWIARRREALTVAQREWTVPEGHVPYLGTALRLTLQPDARAVERRGDELLAPAAGLAVALEAFYRRCARVEVGSRLHAACERAGTSYSRLSIRGQTTRWASCSSSGAMSFNWKLLLAPAAVLDYVVEHEVCHLEVKDHSARFWALVESRCPDHRVHSAWLRRYGPLLSLEAQRWSSAT